MSSYQDALDGAEAVRVKQNSVNNPVIVVWHGGTTFNVYVKTDDRVDYPLQEVDVFNVSDENGRAVDRDTAVDHMNDY